jgi:hypothetical protein
MIKYLIPNLVNSVLVTSRILRGWGIGSLVGVLRGKLQGNPEVRHRKAHQERIQKQATIRLGGHHSQLSHSQS